MLFGGYCRYGMVMSTGCGSRATVLLGRGNLRSVWCRATAMSQR